MGEQTPRRHAIADLIYDYWIDGTLVVLPILSALAGAFYSDEFATHITSDLVKQARIRVRGFEAFFLLTILQAVFAFVNLRRGKRISRLEQRAASAQEWIQDVFATCEGHLYVLGTHSRLALKHTDRISIYAHDEADGSFLLLGRFSPSEKWRQAGRKSYPVGEGCIGRAWDSDEDYVAEFPAKGDSDFLARCAEYGISSDVAGRLRMPSRFYYGWKVRNLAGTKGLAVLIIESEKPRRFTLTELRELVGDYEGYAVRQLIERAQPRVPSVRVAAEAGF